MTSVTHSSQKRIYTEVIEQEIAKAIAEEEKTGFGAKRLCAWASSADGKTVFLLAGISPTPEAISTIEAAVIDGAKRNRIKLFGDRSRTPALKLAA